MKYRILTLAMVVAAIAVPVAHAQSANTEIVEFFKAYDAAFNAKDIGKLAGFYHLDVTIFEAALSY